MTELYKLHRGSTPVLANVPHAGTFVPREIRDTLTPAATHLPDTDWFVDELYAFARERGAGTLTATHSRYVVDLNRPPDDVPLYSSGATSVVPVRSFEGEPIYRGGLRPDDAAVEARVARYWRPYHRVLEAELDRLRAEHGYALLLDCHSIRSRVPGLFEGTLPDLNLGSNGRGSAATGLIDQAMQVLTANPRYSAVLDGRFTGGFITRHYGRPAEHVHAIQLEMSQAIYMHESPPRRDPDAMHDVIMLLAGLIDAMLAWRP